MNTTTHQGFAYDTVALFGFDPASAEPLPEPAPGEIVLRHGGWSLQMLGECVVGCRLMHYQDWYDRYPWSNEKLPSEAYRLRVPVPDSNAKTFAEQNQLLLSGQEVAPVVLVATALLAHRLQSEQGLLKRDYTRCREQTADGNRVALRWSGGRLVVDRWDGHRSDYVWLSSVRTS